MGEQCNNATFWHLTALGLLIKAYRTVRHISIPRNQKQIKFMSLKESNEHGRQIFTFEN